MDFSYICSECKREYAIEPHLMVCPECAKHQRQNQPVAGVLEVALKGTVKQDFTVNSLLPVPERFHPPLPVGGTPLWRPRNLRGQVGFPSLFIKDDSSNPTSSFKDRASFLVSAFAKMHGIDEIVLASTGNAGSSMAGVGAAQGQKINLFLPKAAPQAKLIQALQYGATVHRVDGPYDLAYDLSLEYSVRFGGMNRNTAYNPMTLEGKKTVSLEIYKDLGKAPDYVFVPTGDGCIIGGVYKGFKDLMQMGFIDRMPTIYAVQAEGSDALARAFAAGGFEARPTATVADSICVDVPRNGVYALRHLKEYGGRVITVSDEEIIEAQARLSNTTGLFTEPAGAAAVAGFFKAMSDLEPDASVVLLTTGNGLKDPVTASRGIRIPEKVIRSLNDI